MGESVRYFNVDSKKKKTLENEKLSFIGITKIIRMKDRKFWNIDHKNINIKVNIH